MRLEEKASIDRGGMIKVVQTLQWHRHLLSWPSTELGAKVR